MNNEYKGYVEGKLNDLENLLKDTMDVLCQDGSDNRVCANVDWMKSICESILDMYDDDRSKSTRKMKKSNEFHFSRDDFGWKVKVGGKTHKYPHASVDFLESMYGNGWTAGEAKANWEMRGYSTYGDEYEILSMLAENNPSAELTFGDYD